MKLKHGYWQIRPQELDQILPKVTIARFGAAIIEYHDVPLDVTNVRLIVQTKGDAFQVEGKDGVFRIAPGMLNEAGRYSCYVLATDEHGDQVPLARGAVEVVEMKMESSATVSAMPVSYVMDASGTARQLLAVQDETGEWTLTVGKVCTPFKLGIDPTELPNNLEGADSMGKVKAAVNAISKVLAGSALALAACVCFPVYGTMLDDLSGEDEIYTAPEVDAVVDAKVAEKIIVNEKAVEDRMKAADERVDASIAEFAGKFVMKESEDPQAITGNVNFVSKDVRSNSGTYIGPGFLNVSYPNGNFIEFFPFGGTYDQFDFFGIGDGGFFAARFPEGTGTLAFDNGDIVRRKIINVGGKQFVCCDVEIGEDDLPDYSNANDVFVVVYNEEKYEVSVHVSGGITDFDRYEIVNTGDYNVAVNFYMVGVDEPIVSFKNGVRHEHGFDNYVRDFFLTDDMELARKWFPHGYATYYSTSTVPPEYEQNEETIKRIAEETVTSRPYLERGTDGGIYVVIPE